MSTIRRQPRQAPPGTKTTRLGSVAFNASALFSLRDKGTQADVEKRWNTVADAVVDAFCERLLSDVVVVDAATTGYGTTVREARAVLRNAVAKARETK